MQKKIGRLGQWTKEKVTNREYGAHILIDLAREGTGNTNNGGIQGAGIGDADETRRFYFWEYLGESYGGLGTERLYLAISYWVKSMGIFLRELEGKMLRNKQLTGGKTGNRRSWGLLAKHF